MKKYTYRKLFVEDDHLEYLDEIERLGSLGYRIVWYNEYGENDSYFYESLHEKEYEG